MPPRSPNYRFERSERDRAKARKKAERVQAREARRKAQDFESPSKEDDPDHADAGEEDAK